MNELKWIFRGPGDWYVFYGGREVAWVSRDGPSNWKWGVPQALKSGMEATAPSAKAAAAAVIEECGSLPLSR